MEQVGITPEGLPVLNKIGHLCFSKGVPLEVVIGFFKERGLVVDWVDYIMSAMLDGHNPRTIRARIESATSDIYDGKYASEVLIRADRVITWLTTPSETITPKT